MARPTNGMDMEACQLALADCLLGYMNKSVDSQQEPFQNVELELLHRTLIANINPEHCTMRETLLTFWPIL